MISWIPLKCVLWPNGADKLITHWSQHREAGNGSGERGANLVLLCKYLNFVALWDNEKNAHKHSFLLMPFIEQNSGGVYQQPWTFIGGLTLAAAGDTEREFTW